MIIDEESGNFTGGHIGIRYRLGLTLGFILPIFPLVYILRVSNTISHDTTEIIFIALNFLAKLFFATVIYDAHVELLYKGIYIIIYLFFKFILLFFCICVYVNHEYTINIIYITLNILYL